MKIDDIIKNALVQAKQQISDNTQDQFDIYENPDEMLKVKDMIEKELKKAKYQNCKTIAF